MPSPDTPPQTMQSSKNHPHRISLVAGVLLIIVALLVGTTVFFVMLRYAESLLSNGLQSSLQSRVQLTLTELGAGFDRTRLIATRPLLMDQIQQVNTGADQGAVTAELERIAPSFLLAGFTAIALFDKNGRELAHAGTFTQQAELAIPLNFPGRVQLLWNKHFLLRVEVDMKQQGGVVGKVMTETLLPATMGALNDAKHLGKTGELGLCAPFGLKLQCFPTTLHSQVMTLSNRSAKGDLLPIAHALSGETGFATASDYRDQKVAAAYAPVGNLGLGMVLKIDSAELYAPVWRELRYLIPLLFGLLVIALLLLRWQLIPLVRRLVRSEAEARKMNASLRDSERNLRGLLNNVDEGIVSTSKVGIIELFNPAAERLFDYRGDEVIGKNVSMLMPTPFRGEHDGHLARYLHTDHSHMLGVSREQTAQRKDGTIFPIEIRVSEFYLEGRRKFISIIRDITERKKIEQMKSEFVSVVSHELRTPLTSIRGALGLVNGGLAGELSDKAKGLVRIAYLNSERLSTLVKDLLDIEKITSDKMEYDLKPHPLKALIEQAIDAIRPYGEQYSVGFNFMTMAPQAMVRIDADRFAQVLSNLLSNAIEFSPPAGVVNIKVSSADGWITTSVSDQGPGIPAEFQSRIFQRFSHEDSFDNQRKGGTGLGLSISKALVEKMGGRIWFDASQGTGATFYVAFQVWPAPV